MNFPGGFVIFLFFLASEERVPKQLKQVSIVGKNGYSTDTECGKLTISKTDPKW